jgi:hypothetical protein
VSMHRIVSVGLTALVAVVSMCALVAADAVSDSASAQGLAGSWRGGGRVMFSSGSSERATCRASFRSLTSNLFDMDAICATASARVQQSARVQRVSGSDFSGRFYNREFDVSGTIRIRLTGSRLTVSLRGANGSAFISFRR